ncbi:Hypothetical protein I595_3679 [Croceitalea dokdonensis DOKDO 023]|uniref:Uncharacterized protein n=1 Tax=Croceitalea dokdonensis DOKDO 023 TaxID=1300341 RepID=A0A0P7AXU1_9FLAO|nr:Hypothetical protein I595_3679 [Croceitalea dokdonensis DOKDO 023]
MIGLPFVGKRNLLIGWENYSGNRIFLQIPILSTPTWNYLNGLPISGLKLDVIVELNISLPHSIAQILPAFEDD